MSEASFAVTFFADYAASTNRRQALTLNELAGRIANTSAATKDRLPWLKFATFGDVRSSKGSLRHDANMLSISGVEVDYDGEKIAFDDAVVILEKAGVEALLYTSPSHQRDGHGARWRVLCRLSKEYPPEHRERLVSRVAGLFRNGNVTVLSAESWTRSQAYYFGAVDHNPEHRVELIEGQTLDELDELDLIALGKPASKSMGPGAPTGPADEPALIDQIITGASYHTAAIRLLGVWARHDVPMIEAERRLREAFDAAPIHDQRWRDRVAEIPRLLDDIWGREARKADAKADIFSDWEAQQPPLETVAADLVPPAGPSNADDAEIARLARLKPLAYEREREVAAEQLGCRVSMLDKLVAFARGNGASSGQGKPLELVEIEAWPDPVDGGALVDALSKAVRRYVVLTAAEADAAALWNVGAHCFAVFAIFPRLFITAAEMQSGKTTLLDVLSTIVPRPLMASNITAAALFRPPSTSPSLHCCSTRPTATRRRARSCAASSTAGIAPTGQ
jgi:hypothetical protein